MRWSSLATLTVISCTVLAVAVVSVLLFREAAQEALWRQQRSEAKNVATSLATQIDAKKHGDLVQSENATLYAELLQPLLRAHQQLPELYYVYTCAITTSGDVFVLDTATQADLVSHGRELEASAQGDPAADEAPTLDAVMRQHMHDGQSYAYPEPYVDDFGTFLSAHAPISTATGTLTGYIGVDYDISFIRAELAAIDRYALLSLAAATLLAALIGYAGMLIIRREQSLREQAETHTKDQEQFLAMLSHDVRTPLNGIIGSAELLADTLTQSEQKDRLEAIMSCSETLTILFEDILDLHKYRHGNVPLTQTPTNLYQLTNEVKQWIEQRPDLTPCPIVVNQSKNYPHGCP